MYTSRLCAYMVSSKIPLKMYLSEETFGFFGAKFYRVMLAHTSLNMLILRIAEGLSHLSI